MFTGIIEATGVIDILSREEGGCRLTIASKKLDFSDIKMGDSIAVSGACLTVTALGDATFSADVSNETLQCTTLGELSQGAIVNLEKSLKAESRLGGHLVSGHVDGIGQLFSKEMDGDSLRLVFSSPRELSHYIARKGSVCIDGISLTVNEVDDVDFSVNIIPHTAAETTMDEFEVGRQVNLEVDLISRYLERLLQKSEIAKSNAELDELDSTENLSIEKLKKSGFIK